MNRFVKSAFLILAGLLLPFVVSAKTASETTAPKRQTEVSIHGEDFYINGQPTYKGRVWSGHRIEGLLLNARMVQGVFDDLNSDNAKDWAYPDTKKWDADRNTRDFIAANLYPQMAHDYGSDRTGASR